MCVDPWCLNPLIDPGFTVALGLSSLFTAALLLYALVAVERTLLARVFMLTIFGSLAFQLSILLPGIATTEETALFWRRAFAWGPVLTASTGAHFGVLLNELRIARSTRTLLPFYLGALIVVSGHLTQAIDLDVVRLASGRFHIATGGPLDGYQRAYGGFCVLTLMGSMVAYAWRWRRHPTRSWPARMLVVTLILPMVFAVLVLLRPSGMPDVPLYHVAAPLFQATALYATTRHGVFQITDEANARAAIDTMNEGLLVVDTHSRVLFANRSARQTYGIDTAFIDEGGILHELAPLVGMLSHAEPGIVVREEVEVRGIASRVGVAVVDRPNRHDVAVVLADVRDEVARRQELRRARAEAVVAEGQAQAASRAKTTFLANMSHELRTPLNAIIGYSELLAEEEEDPDRQEDLAKIVQSGRYLHALLGDILDLSKIDAGRLEVRLRAFDLGALIDELRAPAQLLCDRNGNELHLEAPQVQVYADPVRVRQILLNLVSNAAKFTGGGRVGLDVHVTDDKVTIEVSDTGIGMDEVQVAALFARFRQVHRANHAKYGGSGLGLALSRELALLMKGSLTAESVAGSGSTFRLVLPKA